MSVKLGDSTVYVDTEHMLDGCQAAVTAVFTLVASLIYVPGASEATLNSMACELGRFSPPLPGPQTVL